MARCPILYSSESAPGIQKELIEAHSAARSAVIEDFRLLRLYGPSRTRIVRGRAQDKGHRAQFIALRQALEGVPLGGPDPLDTMAVTIHALAQACANRYPMSESQVEDFRSAYGSRQVFVSGATAARFQPVGSTERRRCIAAECER